MILPQSKVGLAQIDITQHDTPVRIFAAVIFRQDFATIVNTGCKLLIGIEVLAQLVQRIQVGIFQVLTMDQRPILVAIFCQKFPQIKILGHLKLSHSFLPAVRCDQRLRVLVVQIERFAIDPKLYFRV